ncbi:DUF3124 domain-containing protein [Neolewinella persica]|uniref:DUF3124 domain-containing protein n=1 Tax=Neolewinella persica TaxID=70998 RepID=UPI0003A67596|nr:DUF3124 domain-containing protein [Neolewinella persica]
MKHLILIPLVILLLTGCNEEVPLSSTSPEDWSKRRAKTLPEGGREGETYLSVYSEIYSYTAHRKFNLTATVSMRNMNTSDTIYVRSASYFDTGGEAVRAYFDHPIFIRPMETVEIVIDDTDLAGGTGGNFIFEWRSDSTVNAPLFEAVMISTSGQQGLSFVTQGVALK